LSNQNERKEEIQEGSKHHFAEKASRLRLTIAPALNQCTEKELEGDKREGTIAESHAAAKTQYLPVQKSTPVKACKKGPEEVGD